MPAEGEKGGRLGLLLCRFCKERGKEERREEEEIKVWLKFV
jgi:hypothetical protein